MKGLLFVYLLTYGGAALALFRPFYGLLVYMCFAVLRPNLLWAWSLPEDGNFSKVIGVALLIGWAISGFGNWNFRFEKPIVLALSAYWCCIVASAIFASNQEVAWAYVGLHSKILIPVLVGMTIVRTRQEIYVLAWTLAACLGFLAFEAHLMYYGGLQNQFRENGMLGMDNNSVCIAMATGVGLCIFLGFSETNPVRKFTAFAMAAMLAHVPMFGDSRGGMLGILTIAVMTFLIIPKKPRMLLTYAVGVLVALRLAGPMVVDRFSTIFAEAEQRDASAHSRLELWKDCWDVMLHHPVLGIGPDHWPLIASQYGWPPGKEAHSVWFNAGAELGFLGVGMLLFFYISTIGLAWLGLCRSRNVPTFHRNIGGMVIAALSGFMVSASFVSLDALEVPFYIVLLGVSSLKVSAMEAGLVSSDAVAGVETATIANPLFVPYRFRLPSR